MTSQILSRVSVTDCTSFRLPSTFPFAFYFCFNTVYVTELEFPLGLYRVFSVLFEVSHYKVIERIRIECLVISIITSYVCYPVHSGVGGRPSWWHTQLGEEELLVASDLRSRLLRARNDALCRSQVSIWCFLIKSVATNTLPPLISTTYFRSIIS